MKVDIFFASETGNAFEAAEILEKELTRYHITTQIYELKDIKDIHSFIKLSAPKQKSLHKKTFSAFFVSTCGQGDIPKSSKKFWQTCLQRNLPSDLLSFLNFSVFALGDSAYAKFNYAGRKLCQRLLQLGAQQICRIGLGDDQHRFGFLGELELWVNLFVKKAISEEIIKDVLPKDYISPSKYDVKIAFQKNMEKSNFSKEIALKKRAWICPIKRKRLLTAKEHFQKVFQIELDLSGTTLKFNTGDVLEVYPHNNLQSTNRLLKLLQIDKTDIIQIELANSAGKAISTNEIGVYCRKQDDGILRVEAIELFKNLLDINATPRRSLFAIMSKFSSSELEKEKLGEFLAPEGREDFYKFNQREKRTFVEVIESFPESIPPLSYLVENIPLISPRSFTISSSSFTQINLAEITAAIVNYKTPYNRLKIGLCSDFFLQRKVGDNIHISISVGSFVKPKGWHKRPLIAVGPGTGLSPFKAMVEERHALKQRGDEIGPIALFLGHRFQSKDYLYGDKYWSRFDGVLEHFSVAFSRDQATKHYVTDDLVEHSKVIWDLLSRDAFVFVSGNAKQIPIDIKNALKKAMLKESSMSEIECQQFFSKLVREKRYQTEVW